MRERIEEYNEVDRQEAIYLANARRAKIQHETEWKQSVWSKIPFWVYFIIVPVIIGLVSGLVSRS